ncbi:2-C-methyl-D-erythritol 4-phosphate cytidylyltransferase [Mucilaginibacter sp. HMF5004]|uniref:2-C-methyl-D-erythritol 4-phosphate cytidylyltransferase n=1 Tax=Mucilaginibacter rivuli TaxID=2857527 RepID=UPI001C5D6E93|nr:2-C-methyl-D-erythritol 4-phosphate cytidylyltransferase [Mucilaginibacter rivuli]
MDLTTNYSILNTQKNYAIIVAGGSGSRMKSAVPKQFLLLNGKPLMMYTIAAFYNSETSPTIIVVLHPNQHQYWKELCIEHDFRIPHHLANGGDTRFQSVKNGLALIKSDSIIAVHDAVRPLTPIAVIDASFNYAAEHGNAIVAVQSRDSIRQLKNNRSAALLRDEIYLVQTPQTFQSPILKKAYEQEYNTAFTDDASVVELSGVDINIIEGTYTNIKVTFPEDIAVAEMFLKN